MNNKTHSYPNFYKTLPVLLFILTLYTALMPETAFAYEMSLFNSKSDSSVQDDFDKRYREARELQDAGEWAKATEKFKALIDKYPNNRSTDAALYYLAYCQKKLNQYKEAGATIDRLVKNFPDSTWAKDGQVMNYEIAPVTGFVTPARVLDGQGIGVTTLEPFQGFTPIGAVDTPRVQLDREDEIKLAAFQSLYGADPAKGISVMGELLSSGSKASENLKIGVLRSVRRPRVWNAYYSSDFNTLNITTTGQNTDKVAAEATAKQNAAMLRDTLVRIFQSESNIKIRKEIIYSLAGSRDDESVAYIGRLYNSESDREVKKTIINGLGSSGGIFGSVYNFSSATTVNGVLTTRATTAPGAIIGQGSSTAVTVNGQSTASAPATVTTAARPLQGRYSINTDNKPRPEGAEVKLLREIGKTEKDDELRRLVYSTLMRMGVSDMIELTSRVYDSENDENYRRNLIQTLGRSKSPEAARKLMDIAKNDKSDKLRLAAISALQNNNSPEVIKFLEDLIK